MTAFRFRAARQDGEIVHGTVDAASSALALDLVSGRGLFPLELEESQATPRRNARATAELADVLGGLAALLEAGLPADRALVAASEAASPQLARALGAACERVREGAALSAALEATGVVPPLVLGLLKAGERSGRLAAAVARAAAEVEREVETRARLRAALTYPAFLAVAGAVSVTAIAGFVVPRFAVLIGDQGRALPASTRLLLSASAFVTHAGPALLVVLAALGAAVVRWARTPGGAHTLHERLLDVPLLGALRLRFATARACAALAGLLEAGVPILNALRHAGQATGDHAVLARLELARAEVERGERLAAALRRHEAVSPSALRLVTFGESSGRLAAFLAHAARLEATAAQRAIQRAVTLLEPALILLFGAIVAFVAAALFQAIYSVRPAGM